jgi:hypothetical protein
VRQLAYYRTTPNKSKTPRYEYHKENLHFPKIDDKYLIDYLDLIGYHKQSYPIDYESIQAFSNMMELDLTIYEVTALKRMSEAYIVECSNKEQNAPIPYMEGERKKIPLSVLKAKFGIK